MKIRPLLGLLFLASLLGSGAAQPRSEKETSLPPLRFTSERAPDAPWPDAFSSEAKPATFSLSEAIELAYRNNASLKVAQSAVYQAHWRYQTASSQPSGLLSLGLSDGFGQATVNANNSGQNFDSYVTASQTFLAFGVLATSRRRAVEDYQGTVSDLRSARMGIYQQVKDAFYELLASQELQVVVQKNLDLTQQTYDMTRQRFKAGASPRLDVINASVDLGNARQDVSNAKIRLSAAQAALNPLLGRPPAAATVAAGAFFSQPLLNVSYQDLRKMAADNSSLQSARHALEFSRLDAVLTVQQNNPFFSVSALYDFPTASYYFNGQLNKPLDWGQIRNAAREKEEIVKSSQYSLQDQALTLAASLHGAYYGYCNAFENARVYASGVLNPSEEAFNVTKIGYTRGALPFVQVVKAEQALIAARNGYLDVLLQVRTAFHQVELAADKELEAPWSETRDEEPQAISRSTAPATESVVLANP